MFKRLLRDPSIRKIFGRAWAPVAIGAAGVVILLNVLGGPDGAPAQADEHIVEIRMPAQLSLMADLGGGVFNGACAECHGKNAVGTDKGPPLIHKIYEPSHHSDFSFVRAVKQGVRQHHWPYGNMPPQPGITDEETLAIIEFIREVQRENGIH